MIEHLLPSWIKWLAMIEVALLGEVDHFFCSCQLAAGSLKPKSSILDLSLSL